MEFLMLAYLLRCDPIFPAGTCLVENISEAVIYIDKIEDCRYYYSVNQNGAVFKENRLVFEFEKDTNRTPCGEWK